MNTGFTSPAPACVSAVPGRQPGVETGPAPDGGGVAFEAMFGPGELQQIQDAFAAATGVASVITRPDGTPITRPSNACRLCRDIIRGTRKGLENCICSDAAIGRHNPGGPIVQPCLSGGLWDAGASITVDGRHAANWLIGQVRNETTDVAKMLAYAREIGADEAEFRRALDEVTVMPLAQFRKVADYLFLVSAELSQLAYRNQRLQAGNSGGRLTAEAPAPALPRGVVLLVDDEPLILNIVRKMLARLEYQVLAAETPEKALRLAGEHAGGIDLLMTDVVMPGMNGQELAGRLLPLRPDMKCLFMSGYPADAVVRNHRLPPHQPFIQKPFPETEMAAKLQEVLAAR